MTPPTDLFAEGWHYHQARDFRRAEDIYCRILRTEPRNGRVWLVLGNLCEEDNRLDEAAAYMRQALELSPREAMGWFHLGNVLLKQEKYGQAEAAYRRCIEIQPSHVEALVNLGYTYGELERLDEARACYQRAMQIRPDDAKIAEAQRELVEKSRRSPPLLVEVSPGELVDKITILQIKRERIAEPAKLANIRAELASLEAVRRDLLPASRRLDELAGQLKAVNEQLWQIEEDVRLCERVGDFGPRFVTLARSVYRTNDRRSELKRAINEWVGARIMEEKAYPKYDVDAARCNP